MAGSEWVAMHRFHRERGEADGDIFGAALMRCRVTNPFSGMGDNSLSGGDIEGTGFMFHAERAFQYDSELVECRSLPWLKPTPGTTHVGHAGGGRLRIDASDVFVDEFRFVAGGLDSRGLRDQSRHIFAFVSVYSMLRVYCGGESCNAFRKHPHGHGCMGRQRGFAKAGACIIYNPHLCSFALIIAPSTNCARFRSLLISSLQRKALC
jgi:hypothetical protein